MTRYWLFATLAICFVLAAAIYFAATRPDQGMTGTDPRSVDVAQTIAPPFVAFRSLAPKDRHGRVGMVPTAAPGGTRYLSPLSCARVFIAAGSGLCLVEEAAGSTVVHAAYVFDGSFRRGARIDLAGIPTRARVSRDGRRAAITVYAEEHSPGGDERLATSSIIIDVATGIVIGNLGDFAIDWGDTAPADGPLDFASIAFDRDADRFFATLLSSTGQFIVRGSTAARQVAVVHAGSTSEALSADGSRLIVKKRIGPRGFWQVGILDLATGSERSLNQGPRSIDDQVEWLDASRLVYHDATEQGTGVWALPVDGVTRPSLLIPEAYSPSVQQ